MEAPRRPPNTQVLIDEQYLSELEEAYEENQEMVDRWKSYLGHVMDFLEVLREHYEEFDKVLKHFNEADNGIDLVVTPDEEIKFKLDENQKSPSNS